MTSSSLIAELPAPARSAATRQTLATVRVLGAAGLVLGVFLAYLGFAWDVQWHTDVGPDTFFTAPHLVLYGGIAISGLTCLAIVLLTTRFTRGTGTALEGTTAIFNDAFRAPLTFEPEGGIADKTATIRITDPHGDWYEVGPLGRHPRQRTLWGLDLISLPEPGSWTIELTVNGMEGVGTGTLSGVMVGPRPGPPPTPMWLIAALPLVFLLWLGVRGWLAVRPGRL